MTSERVTHITKKSENISKWYTDVILQAELADYAPVKGCMVIRPYGYALWESIQTFLDKLIKQRGVKNAYFPLFIPESYLKKEKEHVQGFAPQVAMVTEAGGEKLDEKLVVRPTSETIMYNMYKLWTHSWRGLPVLMNQWCNIVRWEKRTYLFMRTSEFLWQEGHCAHATHEESLAMVRWAMDAYKKTYQELMAIYGIVGTKSVAERFAGGDKTITYEIMTPDGKALQGCTSHDLGQNFSKAFNWTVLDKKGEKLYPWQNSWGFSTRSIGALILAHGDDRGLMFPPAIAPVQIVIVPIFKSETKNNVRTYAREVAKYISKFRVEYDEREGETAGFKFNKWELKGVPIRVEIGQKEMEQKTATIVQRDTGEKQTIALSELTKTIGAILHNMQKTLLAKHKQFTELHTHTVDSYDEFKKIMKTERGFIRAFWCENPECERAIKQETKATTRCLPLNAIKEKGVCVHCGNPAIHRWLFAQAY
ncbi:MAG: proline--tRNA ligase [Candidatus Brennerbacteria bacterium CG11_big_fil_rev_8_21_14_0_20_43_10]|uniref:Proline--tRNA ligase n=1 Tax=Candidatus Brennerbacteria bacterium CG11_big_fil_rev_8_21_14_0_20_43_10 TaxID=1974523 RepID=A0A2H0PXY9_9BACT|nr:MAG: proline--tRNA ligase [Candidatus Brennerbacteria bacterium CG11_big_fil_rev_8_21_14_0_20_43_10]